MRYTFAVNVGETRLEDDTELSDREYFSTWSPRTREQYTSFIQAIPQKVFSFELRGLSDNGFSGLIELDLYKTLPRDLSTFIAQQEQRSAATKYGLSYPLLVTIETPELGRRIT